MARDEDTDRVMDEAVAMADAPVMGGIHQYGTSLLAAGRNDKAMAICDTKNAIANWEIAIRNIPENQNINRPVYERALQALKEK